jgi:hypothetical protein
MNTTMATKLGMERCADCDHRWIDYEGARGRCFMCGSTSISECVSLRDVRDAISELRNEDKKYLDTHAKRTIILKQRYREIAELSLHRAQEIYAKVKDHYQKGNLTDKVIDQLIIAFRLFSELGIHKSAVSIAYMTAMAYAQRGVEKEIHVMDDLNDLVAARQWFIRLGSQDWEAAVNLHIGERAMSTISTDPNLLQVMMQVSLWHFYKARDYYFHHRNPKMVERVQFDIERATDLLTSYTRGLSQIESAKIAAQSTIRHGEQVRKGLESFGRSFQEGMTVLGEHIESAGGNVSRALHSTSIAMSTNLAAAGSSGGSSLLKGRSLDKRMAELGRLLTTSAHEVPEGFAKPMNKLGTKFALGTAAGGVTGDPSVIDLSDSVLPEAKRSEEGLRQLDEPTIKLTGTLLDTLVSKGIGKVIEQLETSDALLKKP